MVKKLLINLFQSNYTPLNTEPGLRGEDDMR